MLDILPPDFTGSFREQLYAIAQWLKQYEMLLAEKTREWQNASAIGVNRNVDAETLQVVNTTITDTEYYLGTEYGVVGTYIYDDPVQEYPGFWFAQRHGDNRYLPSALETYGAFSYDIAAENIYSAISSYLPIPYKTTPYVIKGKTGNGFLLLGVCDAEENLEVNNEGEEEPT